MDGLPRRLAVIVLIVLLALLLPSHGTHARAPSSFFGVSLGSPDINGVDLSRMHHARVKEAHWTLFWPGIEAVNDHFNWSGPDRLIGKLASKGIRLMPVLYGSPSYAAPTQQTPPLGSASAKNEWSEFVRYAVLRYGPGGAYWTHGYRQKYPGHRAKPIKEWQVWNEPNLDSYFQPKASPSKYAELLRISHDAIKGADPKAKVILAGMPAYARIRSWTFLSRLYGQGVKRYFDAAAAHPYAPTLRYQARAIRRMRAVMNHHGDRQTPLWITELGWGSAHPDRFGLNKGIKGQKRFLIKSFRLVLHHRKRWKIQRLFWFEWRDLDPNRPPGYCSGSLCGSGGLFKFNQTPKPSWHAFLRFSR